MIRISNGDLAINVDGDSFQFRPTFRNCLRLGSPSEVVELFRDLFFAGALEENPAFAMQHLRKCFRAAFQVLVACSERDDIDFLGELKPCKSGVKFAQRAIPAEDIIHLGRHLMKHMVIGEPDDSKKPRDSDYSDEFDASEFVDMAILHLGLPESEALDLSMTRFQKMVKIKFPEQKSKEPTDEEYDETMAWLDEVNKKRAEMH